MKLSVDELENYLLAAPVIGAEGFQKHGAHNSFLVLLEGGVAALAKPADEVANEGELMVRRESAAWFIARDLGWRDLVSATVVRRLPSFKTGQPVPTSLQILWPDNQPDADPAAFPDEDVWRAAAFDALVNQADRGGHNWLAVPPTGESRLKLSDHGYSLAPGVMRPNSTFFVLKEGMDLPEFVSEGLRRLVAGGPCREVLDLLPMEVLESVFERAHVILQHGALQVP